MGAKRTFDPAEHFALQDIALWTASLRRDEQYQPEIHQGKCVVQTMKSVEPEFYSAGVEGSDEEVDLLRVLVKLGLRSVFKESDSSTEVAIYTIEATFAVDYVVHDLPEIEDFSRFVDFNCVHNAWPFWRQHVYDTLKRASLPVPVVPLFSGKKSNRRKKNLTRLTGRYAISDGSAQ